jgi:hypothetical protein
MWTATDASHNRATAIQKVTVVDTTPPVLTAPADVGPVEQADRDGTTVVLGQATATDVCDAAPTIANNAPTKFPLGTTPVKWTATDQSGNVAAATQQVTVVDTTKPTLTAPADVTVEQTGLDGTPVDLGQATATDLCCAAEDIDIANDAPAVFPLGITPVTWTATDDAGNVTTATQQVTIMDTTAPTLTNVPAPLTAEQTDLAGTPVTVPLPQVSDICDANPILSSDAPAVFPLGTTTVTFTAEDASGNRAAAETTVTVVDTTPPTLTPPDDVEAEQENRDGTAVDLGHPVVEDVCDAAPEVTHDAPAVFPLGTTTVTWTATDASGNSVTATQNVTVVDTTAPTLTVNTAVTSLWPPNHDLVDVGLTLSVQGFSNPTVTISVTQDEPVEDQSGDGNFSPDAKILRDGTGKITGLRLRAERKGDGDGRVYLILVTATDASGHVAQACCAVTVPKSQSKKDKAAVAAQAAAAVAAGVPLAYDSTAGPVVGPKQ